MKSGAQVGDSETQPPATSARTRSAAPAREASPTLPGLQDFIHHPINTAMGMVQAMVKNPQGEARSAFTTTSASTARRMIMMRRIAIIPVTPATRLISSLAICPSDFPSRRSEQQRMVKSWTAPASTTPMTIQIVPGR